MDERFRIAIIDPNKCKPDKCNKECKKKCPVNYSGKECIVVAKVAKINENMCTGCGICPNVCPFSAIKIYNLPSEIKTQLTYSYGENKFKLYKMFNPKLNMIQGIIGENGVGKSTMIKIISNEVNLDPDFLLKKYKGTELFKYLSITKLIFHDNVRCITLC